MSTLREVIDKVLLRASLEAGVDTNHYADEAVQQMVQSTFDTLFDMWWWPQFYTPADTSIVLDGLTGKPTMPVGTKIDRFLDIRYVWYGNNTNPMPRAPLRANPASITQPCVSPSSDSIFQILPVTSKGPITVAYRTRPKPFDTETDIVDMDEEMMVLGTAYDYVNSLGLNPGAEDKLQSKYQNRIQTLMSEMQQMDVAMGPGGSIPTNWGWY